MKLKDQRVVICGAGGFIGGHLVNYLLADGVNVVQAVDLKPVDEWHQTSPEVENLAYDLRELESCRQATEGADKALCMLSVLVNTHMLIAARDSGAERFSYSSSACAYNDDKQNRPDLVALKSEATLTGSLLFLCTTALRGPVNGSSAK